MPAVVEIEERPAATTARLLGAWSDRVERLPDLGPRIDGLRREARERFVLRGLPGPKEEAWRFTNLGPIARGEFVAAADDATIAATDVDLYRTPEAAELVLVDGRVDPELSRLEGLPAGVFVGDLAAAQATCPDVLVAHLARHIDLEHPFVSLAAAHLGLGAVVHVPRGTRVERPIHLLFLSSDGGRPTVTYPWVLIVVEDGAQATVIERWAGVARQPTLVAPVTETAVGSNATLDHYRLCEEGPEAFHVGSQVYDLERDSSFTSHAITHGGRLVRNDVRAALNAPGISCTLNGLYLARGRQHVDTQMKVDHLAPNCNSWELYKGILEEKARAVFSGRIYVAQDAQKTDAKQSNRNLLLSPEALVQSNPQLEIFADDVRCTHGSTTGHLEDEAVFYLRSRGIGREAAKSLLIWAFAAEVLDEIRLPSMRRDLEDLVLARLPRGEVVRHAV